jgi:hypothetical protein
VNNCVNVGIAELRCRNAHVIIGVVKYGDMLSLHAAVKERADDSPYFGSLCHAKRVVIINNDACRAVRIGDGMSCQPTVGCYKRAVTVRTRDVDLEAETTGTEHGVA